MPASSAPSLLQRLHRTWVSERRTRILAERLAPLMPRDARVLDVGCGDGAVAAAIRERRPDLRLRGIDTFVRSETHIEVTAFDGERIPEADGSWDVVLFVDVLHHAVDPEALLREGARVAGRAVVVKDHDATAPLADFRLRRMDRVGNPSEGVALPFHYWPRRRWLEACERLGLEIAAWEPDIRLYPGPFDWVFGRSLQFVARLNVAGARAGP